MLNCLTEGIINNALCVRGYNKKPIRTIALNFDVS